MKKGILVLVIVILIVIVAGLVWYIINQGKTRELGGSLKQINSLYLEKFPTGTEMKPGVKGIEATSFTKGDIMGISGEATAPPKTMLSVKIFNKDGGVIMGNGAGMELKGSGGFGMCCFEISDNPGEYTMKLYLDGQEAKSLIFEVK
jgi:uncharacterized protein YxeA